MLGASPDWVVCFRFGVEYILAGLDLLLSGSGGAAGGGLHVPVAFMQACETRAVDFKHVRFGRCPVVIDR